MPKFFTIILLAIFYLSNAYGAPTISSGAAGQYLAAKVAEKTFDTKNAAEFFNRAILLDSENKFLQQEAFKSFVLNGDFELAIELVPQINAQEKSDMYELSLFVRAANHIKNGEYQKAMAVLEYDWYQPINKLAATTLQAWSLSELLKSDEAMEKLTQLEGPLWFELFVDYHLGLIALNNDKKKQGTEYLKKAFENRAAGRGAEKTYLQIINFYSIVLAEQGLIEESIAIAESAMNTNHPSWHVLSKMLQSKNIEFPKFKINEAAAEIFLNLGTAVNKNGGINFARPFFQLGHYLNPNSSQIIMELGFMYEQAKLLEQANNFFLLVPKSSPLWLSSRLQVAINLDELGEYEKSQKLFMQLLQQQNKNLLPILTLANINARHKNFEQTIPLLESYIARLGENVSENHWQLFYRLGIAYERTQNWQQAENNFQRALELFPNSPEVLNYLGYSWVDMGINLQQGLELISKAVELRPNDGYMIDSLGWVYYRLERFEDAVAELERAINILPADPTINDHLGDAYWQVGRKLEAKYQWRHALSFDPPTPEDVLRIKEKLTSGLVQEEKEVSSNP